MCIGYLHLDVTEEKIEASNLQVTVQEQLNQKYCSTHFCCLNYLSHLHYVKANGENGDTIVPLPMMHVFEASS